MASRPGAQLGLFENAARCTEGHTDRGYKLPFKLVLKATGIGQQNNNELIAIKIGHYGMMGPVITILNGYALPLNHFLYRTHSMMRLMNKGNNSALCMYCRGPGQ